MTRKRTRSVTTFRLAARNPTPKRNNSCGSSVVGATAYVDTAGSEIPNRTGDAPRGPGTRLPTLRLRVRALGPGTGRSQLRVETAPAPRLVGSLRTEEHPVFARNEA